MACAPPSRGRPEWAAKIRNRRQVAGLSQEELAARAGVAPGAVRAWESGKHYPSRHVGNLEQILSRPGDPFRLEAWDGEDSFTGLTDPDEIKVAGFAGLSTAERWAVIRKVRALRAGDDGSPEAATA